ncbi:DUF4330 domain-containing protein [Proteiniborus sp.]|uniref:DUF4330 domain-containing protein n=1 Tax=Proteiniborus sp. TaxID=2079015 RepID=UPI00331BD1BE
MKNKFNWIDIVIIIVIIGLVFGAFSYFRKPNAITADRVPIKVIVRVDKVLMETVNGINVGDVFKDKDTNQVFGKAIDKKVTETYEMVETGDGRVVKATVPNRYSVFITLEGDAVVTEDYIRLGGRDVRIEGTIELKSTKNAIKTKVVDFQLAE